MQREQRAAEQAERLRRQEEQKAAQRQQWRREQQQQQQQEQEQQQQQQQQQQQRQQQRQQQQQQQQGVRFSSQQPSHVSSPGEPAGEIPAAVVYSTLYSFLSTSWARPRGTLLPLPQLLFTLQRTFPPLSLAAVPGLSVGHHAYFERYVRDF